MTNDQGFTHTDSISVIQGMINKAKDQFSENGHLYLLWGWLVFFCSLGHFILIHIVKYEHHYIIWMLTWLLVIYQVFYLSRRSKTIKVRTYTDHIIGYVWLVFIILLFLIGFVIGMIMGGGYFIYINPLVLALYGAPTFLSGIILRFRPLVIGGIACWILSLAATVVPYDYQFLLLSLAMVMAWIIPGYILRARYNKANN